MPYPELFEPALWCALSLAERRERLAAALRAELGDAPGVVDVRIGVGSVERPYDLTALVESDVGELRAPLWSHARAVIFCDESVHVANRKQLAPGRAVQDAAAGLRARLAVPATLESRGLTLTLRPAPDVERTWAAERARFRDRTAVTREDRIAAAGDVDLRELLARHYTGPALRVVGPDGVAFLLPAAAEPDAGPLVTLCRACRHWAEGSLAACPQCGAPADTVVAARPAGR